MSTLALEQQHHGNLATMQQPQTAKKVRIFVNGDHFNRGRNVVVKHHIINFDKFLDEVTFGIKAPFGAVRNIYTPNSGHRVLGLNQLEDGMDLVAGGLEKFRSFAYKEINQKRRPAPRKNYLETKRIHNRMDVSARWRKYVKDPCQIFVYGNGDINAPAMRLLLIPRCMKSWDLVLCEITEKICARTGNAVRKLYSMDYRQLFDPAELENGHYYVAVGNEKLKKFPYGEIGAAAHQKSPRRNALPPLRRTYRPKPPNKEENEKSYTKMYAQRKHAKEQEETTVMGASAVTGYKPLRTKKYKPQRPSGAPPTHEGESVFHAKPVKVKRSGVRTAAPAATASDSHPPTGESDSVFHANSRAVKAEEVDEDEDTKVDLPIDQVPADVVDDEEVHEVIEGSGEIPEDVNFNGKNAEEQIEEDIRTDSPSAREDDTADPDAPHPTAATPVLVPRTPQGRDPSPEPPRNEDPPEKPETPKQPEEEEVQHPTHEETAVIVTSLDDDHDDVKETSKTPDSDRESDPGSPIVQSRPSSKGDKEQEEEEVVTEDHTKEIPNAAEEQAPVEDTDESQLSNRNRDEDEEKPDENVVVVEENIQGEEPQENKEEDDDVTAEKVEEKENPNEVEAVSQPKDDLASSSPQPPLDKDPQEEQPEDSGAQEGEKEDADDRPPSSSDGHVKEELEEIEAVPQVEEQATNASEETNILTPSSPLPDDDGSRSDADGEDLKRPTYTTGSDAEEEHEQHSKTDAGDSERSKPAEEARPDSNALTVEGDPPITATPNSSIPNGTANGIQEIQS